MERFLIAATIIIVLFCTLAIGMWALYLATEHAIAKATIAPQDDGGESDEAA